MKTVTEKLLADFPVPPKGRIAQPVDQPPGAVVMVNNGSIIGQELQHICELIVDCEHKTAPIQTEGYPSIRTPNVGRGRLILDGVNRVSEETYRRWTQRSVPRAGDLILAREAPIGNVAIVPRKLKVCLGQRTVLIRPDRDKVVPAYLGYLLLGDEIQGRIQSYSNGATVHHLNMKDIRELALPPLPPKMTQHKIAAILSAYDDLIENNTRRIRILEEMAQALYREWFVHFRFPGHEQHRLVESELGPIPEGWEIRNIGGLVETLGGGTPSTAVPTYWGGKINWFSPTDLTSASSMFAFNSGKTITEEGLQKSSAHLFPAYSVMMTSRATIGVVAINTTPACTNQGFITCIPNRAVSAYQLYYWLHENKDKISGMATGATFKEINKTTFRQLPIIVADPDVRDRFAKSVEPFARQIENLLRRNVNLRQTRDLLLPRLISGEVDVSELDIAMEDKNAA